MKRVVFLLSILLSAHSCSLFAMQSEQEQVAWVDDETEEFVRLRRQDARLALKVDCLTKQFNSSQEKFKQLVERHKELRDKQEIKKDVQSIIFELKQFNADMQKLNAKLDESQTTLDRLLLIGTLTTVATMSWHILRIIVQSYS